MAAKSGIFDFILKGAAKSAAKGAGKAAATMPKKAAPAKPTPPGRFGPNVKVLPGNEPKRGPMGRMGKYIDETGRPAMLNARPLAKKRTSPKQEGPMPKKAVPAKKAVPGPISKETAQKMAKNGVYPKKPVPVKPSTAVKKPVPVKPVVPVKKTQPFVPKPAAPAFKEPGGKTSRPTMGLKKYPPKKKPQ